MAKGKREIAVILASHGLVSDAATAALALEVLGTTLETRLRFNSPTPAACVVVRLGRQRIELCHWLHADEWEVIEVTEDVAEG